MERSFMKREEKALEREPCSHSHRVTVKKRILVISLMALFLYYNLLIINNIYIIIKKKRENVGIPKK